jgi:hypothetical protein
VPVSVSAYMRLNGQKYLMSAHVSQTTALTAYASSTVQSALIMHGRV